MSSDTDAFESEHSPSVVDQSSPPPLSSLIRPFPQAIPFSRLKASFATSECVNRKQNPVSETH